MPRKPDDFFFNRSIGPQAGATEHERAINACIPEAADIANQRVKQDLKQKRFKDDRQKRIMATRHFLEAMDEITARKGLRVFARQGRREILFRKFDLQGGGK